MKTKIEISRKPAKAIAAIERLISIRFFLTSPLGHTYRFLYKFWLESRDAMHRVSTPSGGSPFLIDN